LPDLVLGRVWSVNLAKRGAANDMPTQAFTVDGDDALRDVARTATTPSQRTGLQHE